jgi:hypothetical protein
MQEACPHIFTCWAKRLALHTYRSPNLDMSHAISHNVVRHFAYPGTAAAYLGRETARWHKTGSGCATAGQRLHVRFIDTHKCTRQ